MALGRRDGGDRLDLRGGRPSRRLPPGGCGGAPHLMELEVEEGDIAALDVDAIANAANDRLWMGAGVAGALKRAGGDEIEREAVAKGPIPLGTAIATGPGRLNAMHVLHGAGMGQDPQPNAGLDGHTTRSCLELADQLGAPSLPPPAVGPG